MIYCCRAWPGEGHTYVDDIIATTVLVMGDAPRVGANGATTTFLLQLSGSALPVLV